MDRLNILVTGGGSPGIAGTLYSLKGHRIVCTDMKENCAGEYLADKFYQIPPASDELEYHMALDTLCLRERIDVILPQNTVELDFLYRQRNNMPAAIACNRNITKDELSEGRLVENFDDLVSYTLNMDKFVIKPLNSSGGRGVRIVSSQKPDFFRKPGIPIIRWQNLFGEIGREFKFWVMPFYEGKEYTVDCFRGKQVVAIPRSRDQIRSGVSFSGRLEKRQDLIAESIKWAVKLDLKYAFGFQFIGDKIIECNPRVQGTMAVSTLAGANLIEAACFEALGLDYPKFDINWDVKFNRYWGLIVNGDKI